MDAIPSRRDGPAWMRQRRPRPPADEKELDRFLNRAAWRKCREWYRKHHPLCERCRAAGVYTATAVIHHKIDRRERPDLAYHEDNLEALCEPCHNAESARRQIRRPPR